MTHHKITFTQVVQAVLSTVITTGFFAVIILLMFAGIDATMKDVLLVLIGALGAAFGAVTQYFFGSSYGSAKVKEDLMMRTSGPTIVKDGDDNDR